MTPISNTQYLKKIKNNLKKSDLPDLNQGPLDVHETSTVKCSSS